MAGTTIDPSAFETGADESITVEDVYNSGSLGVDTSLTDSILDTSTSSSSLSLAMQDIGKSFTDLTNVQIMEQISFKEGVTTVAGLKASAASLKVVTKDIKTACPQKASIKVISAEFKDLKSLASDMKTLKSGVSSRTFNALSDSELVNMVVDMRSVRDYTLGLDSRYTVANLLDADGNDISVTSALTMMVVRSICDEGDIDKLRDYLKTVKVPPAIKDIVLSKIVQIAAEAGLADFVTELLGITPPLSIDITNSTIKGILKGFKWELAGILPDLQKTSQDLIADVATWAGMNSKDAATLGKILGGKASRSATKNRQLQAETLYATLNLIDSKWIKRKRNGVKIYHFEKLDYASDDALEALLLIDDIRPTVAAFMEMGYRSVSWKRDAKKLYPIYYG